MRRGRDPLVRALLARAGARAGVASERRTPWVSVTLAGARHEIALTMPLAAVAGFCMGIDEAEFRLGAQLLADIIAIPGDRDGGVRIAALTISEAA